MFDADDYNLLRHLAFLSDHTGCKPNVIESPHGDGKLDAQKRYAHVALKYQHPSHSIQQVMDGYLTRAHRAALDVARELKVPEAFMPRLDFGALRVLEYPVGAVSHEHTDFDLFTITLYRDDHKPFKGCKLNVGGHPTIIGEIGELVGLGPATPHSVAASNRIQRSIVYFAIPDWNAKLTYAYNRGGELEQQTVGEWLAERVARSRYDAPQKEAA